jgi:hypothetical protein
MKREVDVIKEREVVKNSVAGFLLRIGKVTILPEKGTGTMSVIVQRPHAYLQQELRRTFAGQEDVKVIVDRRYGERRTRRQSIAVERRCADRRRSKEQLVEVVISV